MTTNEKPEATAEQMELAIGVENLRRMFRQTMAQAAIERGENIAEARARIARDPATAKVAEMLSASVDELLEGFGEQQTFIVDINYDHAAEVERIEAIVERVATTAIGLNDALHQDGVERVRRSAPLSAPHIESMRARGGQRLVAERMQRRADRTPRVTKSFTDRWR